MSLPKTSQRTNTEFGPVFDQAAESYGEICNPYAVARRREFVSRYVAGRVLEVGAANGEVCHVLKDRLRVTSCDISFKMCLEARRKRDLAAVNCDAEFLPFADASFDTVVATEVIYYLSNPLAFLKEALRVLGPSGRLVLTTANQSMVWADKTRALLRKIGFSQMYFDDGIRNFIPIKRITTMMTEAGYRDINVEKMIVVPSASFDGLNRVLERTPLKHFSLFIAVSAGRE